ncbi:HCP-like protein [Gonapodya prolifera JEL478]|uniref:HCP-like protein n=1 Tax=Gonapodya prolifera (strain JEL478) TaxID=1344416 RepID=A0A139AJJ3_GONPJ|nr:HCP-like protein [Gonapodya prolifera JEL478]|eukprot:KXS16575.1 HCP-like protein [Gonapodya prolifera JEL478]
MADARPPRPSWHIQRRDVSWSNICLGRGGFGSVYQGTWKLLGPVAVKTLRADFSDGNVKQDFLNEVRVWASILPHDNIVPLHGACVDSHGEPFMISRLMESDAITYLKKKKSEGVALAPLKLKLLHEVALGMYVLEQQGIAHLDLKPGNILVSRDGTGAIADFGMAKYRAGSRDPLSGTDLYMPPEALRPRLNRFIPDTNLSQGRDIYAFGITCYALWVLGRPYSEPELAAFDELKNAIAFAGKRPNLSDPRLADMPDALKNLMVRCWNNDVASRPTSFARGIVPVLASLRTLPVPWEFSASASRQDSGYTSPRDSSLHPFEEAQKQHAAGNLEAAAASYRVAAEMGHAEAQFCLGLCFWNGAGLVKDIREAVRWFEEAAKSGSKNAQTKLGDCYRFGEGRPKVLLQAAEMYYDAALQEHAEAQRKLGELYSYGLGVERDHRLALQWLMKAAGGQDAAAKCWVGHYYAYGYAVVPINNHKAVELWQLTADQGSPAARMKMGWAYWDGDNGLKEDKEQAWKWLQKALDQGYPHTERQQENPQVQHDLGLCYYNGVTMEKDFQQAVQCFRKAAEQGDACAHYYLGGCYLQGYGVEKDVQQAVQWFRKAAEQGLAHAQMWLGCCYYRGEGVMKDVQQAVQWIRKPAEQGLADAQSILGKCYYNGAGVEKDFQQAVQWYRKAAEQGDADAQSNLGGCYYTGEGVEKDFLQAVHWYRKAAEQGDADAQSNLGGCYYTGEGVEKDFLLAVHWYCKAAEQGDAAAKSWLRIHNTKT